MTLLNEAVTQTISVVVPDSLIDEIAAIAAHIVVARLDITGETGIPTLMTVTEAADYLRCKPQRIYDLVSSRRIPRFKDGSRTLIARADIDAYLQQEPGLRHVALTLPPAPQTRKGSATSK